MGMVAPKDTGTADTGTRGLCLRGPGSSIMMDVVCDISAVRTMATGWAKDGAVQDQIDASIKDALKSVRRRLPAGESRRTCGECGHEIPQARREALPGVRLCIACQQEVDKQVKTHSLYNRRGSKDSQLR